MIIWQKFLVTASWWLRTDDELWVIAAAQFCWCDIFIRSTMSQVPVYSCWHTSLIAMHLSSSHNFCLLAFSKHNIWWISKPIGSQLMVADKTTTILKTSPTLYHIGDKKTFAEEKPKGFQIWYQGYKQFLGGTSKWKRYWFCPWVSLDRPSSWTFGGCKKR